LKWATVGLIGLVLVGLLGSGVGTAAGSWSIEKPKGTSFIRAELKPSDDRARVDVTSVLDLTHRIETSSESLDLVRASKAPILFHQGTTAFELTGRGTDGAGRLVFVRDVETLSFDASILLMRLLLALVFDHGAGCLADPLFGLGIDVVFGVSGDLTAAAETLAVALEAGDYSAAGQALVRAGKLALDTGGDFLKSLTVSCGGEFVARALARLAALAALQAAPGVGQAILAVKLTAAGADLVVPTLSLAAAWKKGGNQKETFSIHFQADRTTPMATSTPTPSLGVHNAPPSDFRVIVLDATHIRFDWRDNTDSEGGFSIWYAGDSCGPVRCLNVTQVGANVTSYVWATPSTEGRSCFAVNASGQNVPTAISNIACTDQIGETGTRGKLPFETWAVVRTGGECLNLRAAPSTSATSLRCLPDRTTLHLKGQPTIADGYTWLPSEEPKGWVAWEGGVGWSLPPTYPVLPAASAPADLILAITSFASSFGLTYDGDCDRLPASIPGPLDRRVCSTIREEPGGPRVVVGIYFDRVNIGFNVTFLLEGGNWRAVSLGPLGNTGPSDYPGTR
jgi:hypothetical protein